MRRFKISSIRSSATVPPDQLLKLTIDSAEARPTKRAGLNTLRLDLQVSGGEHAGKKVTTFNLLDERGLSLLRKLLRAALAREISNDDEEIDLDALRGRTITGDLKHDGEAYRVASIVTGSE